MARPRTQLTITSRSRSQLHVTSPTTAWTTHNPSCPDGRGRWTRNPSTPARASPLSHAACVRAAVEPVTRRAQGYRLTALVLQGLLGGDLMVADVEYEGRVEGVHYWNVTAGGIEVDLTRDQFTNTETLVNVRRVTTRRNHGGAGEQPFQRLQERVTAALHHEAVTRS
jgi:hypothetical protein